MIHYCTFYCDIWKRIFFCFFGNALATLHSNIKVSNCRMKPHQKAADMKGPQTNCTTLLKVHFII